MLPSFHSCCIDVHRFFEIVFLLRFENEMYTFLYCQTLVKKINNNNCHVIIIADNNMNEADKKVFIVVLTGGLFWC